MTTMTLERENVRHSVKHSIKCYCGGTAVRTVGTIEEKVHGKMIKINNAPFYKCNRCGDELTSSKDRISTQARNAYDNGFSEVEFEDYR